MPLCIAAHALDVSAKITFIGSRWIVHNHDTVAHCLHTFFFLILDLLYVFGLLVVMIFFRVVLRCSHPSHHVTNLNIQQGPIKRESGLDKKHCEGMTYVIETAKHAVKKDARTATPLRTL